MKRKISIIALLLAILTVFSVFPANAMSYEQVKKSKNYFYGVDVSKWNGTVNWAALKNKGIEFAYIRIGWYENDGGHLDVKFKENVKNCVENGIEFGVYVYSYVYKYSQVKACANWINKQLKAMGNYCKNKKNIQVAYDLEDSTQVNAISSGKISRTYLQNSVVKFSNTVKSNGYVPVIYSYESYFNSYLNITKFQKAGMKIWYARWPSYVNTAVKYTMGNNTKADIWQFTDNLIVNGVRFDCNVCYTDFYDYTKETSKVTVKGLKAMYSYKSTGVKPKVSVYYNNKLLTANKDYKIVYLHNKNIGTGKLKVIRYNSSGAYQDTKTFTYKISNSLVNNVKSSSTNSSVTISWTKDSNAKFYNIYKYCKSTQNYEYVYNTKDDNITFEDLKSNTNYKFKVSKIIELNGEQCEGAKTKVTIKTLA